MEDIKGNVNEMVPNLVEDKLLSTKSALDAVRQTEGGMRRTSWSWGKFVQRKAS